MKNGTVTAMLIMVIGFGLVTNTNGKQAAPTSTAAIDALKDEIGALTKQIEELTKARAADQQTLSDSIRRQEDAGNNTKQDLRVEKTARTSVKEGVELGKSLHTAGPPHIAPDAFQSCDDAINDEMMPVAVSLFERIQSHRVLKIRRVEVSDMVRSMRRDAIEEFFRHIPVRIDKAHSPSLVDILEDEIPKQGAFPCAGLADHVHMPPSLGSRDLDGLIIAPIYGRANNAHTTPYPLTASCLCLNEP
jgi:hypothetical protein